MLVLVTSALQMQMDEVSATIPVPSHYKRK